MSRVHYFSTKTTSLLVGFSEWWTDLFFVVRLYILDKHLFWNVLFRHPAQVCMMAKNFVGQGVFCLLLSIIRKEPASCIWSSIKVATAFFFWTPAHSWRFAPHLWWSLINWQTCFLKNRATILQENIVGLKLWHLKRKEVALSN